MIRDLIRTWGTVFAALLGLAFGSFLNVCLSRWPEGESVVKPRSHCRKCGRVLPWWENVPLVSWVALKGRCRGCDARISWRYLIVEAALGGLWAAIAWRALGNIDGISGAMNVRSLIDAIALAVFSWLLLALAALDFEHLWLPNFLTLPGICVGVFFSFFFDPEADSIFQSIQSWRAFLLRVSGILCAAGLILLIHWIYWLIRHREGIGLGDAKLMALLAAWLGLRGALLAFGIGVVLGAAGGLVMIAIPKIRKDNDGARGQLKLPLGTFLCIGGIVTGFWGREIIAAYLHWAGF